MKRFLFSVLLLLSAISFARAQNTPVEVVTQAIESTVKAVQNNPAAQDGDTKAIAEIVKKTFLPATDFNRTTRITIGTSWTSASADEQAQLYQQFSILMTHLYAASLAQLGNQPVQFSFKLLEGTKDDALVASSVTTGANQQVVRYRLHQTPQGWKIYDIDMSGVWLIQIYQSQFAQVISNKGIKGLIDYLKQHNARSF